MNKNNVNEVILNDKDICKKAYDLLIDSTIKIYKDNNGLYYFNDDYGTEVYELGNLKQVEEYLLACSDENSIM